MFNQLGRSLVISFRPSLESLEPRWTPDGPRPLGVDGLPLPVPPPPPEGSPVITIDVMVIQWVANRV